MATAPSLESTCSDDLVNQITEAVAASSGADPLTLPPLEHAVDTGAIDALVDTDGFTDLTFTYHDHLVTIDGDGHVRVSPIDQW